MGKISVVEKIVQSLSFEVEAVPHKFNQAASTSDHAPVNVKIRVRKRNEAPIQCGVISVPSVKKPVERIRLISSDQTIMSFDLQMEEETDKKPLRKPRKRIFDMLPGGCLSTQNDDDEFPYVPATSYNANLIKGSFTSNSDGILKQNFTLSRSNYEDTRIIGQKNKQFLGKCKPGGCLDPPFSEEKYPYKPASKKKSVSNSIVKDESANLKIDTDYKSKVLDIDKDLKKNMIENNLNGSKVSSKRETKTNSILSLYKTEPLKTSISMSYSNSIITYPPDLTSSQMRLNEERNVKKRESDERSRNSFMEFTDIYFPPKNTTNRLNKIATNLSVPDQLVKEHRTSFVEAKEDKYKVNKLKLAELDATVNIEHDGVKEIDNTENELSNRKHDSSELGDTKIKTEVNKPFILSNIHPINAAQSFVKTIEDNNKVNELKLAELDTTINIEYDDVKELQNNENELRKSKDNSSEWGDAKIKSDDNIPFILSNIIVHPINGAQSFVETKEDNNKVNELKLAELDKTINIENDDVKEIENTENELGKIKYDSSELRDAIIKSDDDITFNLSNIILHPINAAQSFVETKEDNSRVNELKVAELDTTIDIEYDDVKEKQNTENELSKSKDNSSEWGDAKIKSDDNIPFISSNIIVHPINAAQSFVETKEDNNKVNELKLADLDTTINIEYGDVKEIENTENELGKIKYKSSELRDAKIKSVDNIPFNLSNIMVYPINAAISKTGIIPDNQSDISKTIKKETKFSADTSFIKLESELIKIDLPISKTSEVGNTESEVISSVQKLNIKESENSEIEQLQLFENIINKTITNNIESSDSDEQNIRESGNEITIVTKPVINGIPVKDEERKPSNENLNNISPYKIANDTGLIQGKHSELSGQTISKSNKFEPDFQNKSLEIVTSRSTAMSKNSKIANDLDDITINPIKPKNYNDVQKLSNKITLSKDNDIDILKPISLHTMEIEVESLVNVRKSNASSITKNRTNFSTESTSILEDKYPSHQIINNNKQTETVPYTSKINIINDDVDVLNKNSIITSNATSSITRKDFPLISKSLELDEKESTGEIPSKRQSVPCKSYTNTKDIDLHTAENQDKINESGNQQEFANEYRDEELSKDQPFMDISNEDRIMNLKNTIDSENIKILKSTPNGKFLDGNIKSSDDYEKKTLSYKNALEKECLTSYNIPAQSLETKPSAMSHEYDDYNKARVKDIINYVDRSQLAMSNEEVSNSILFDRQSKASSSSKNIHNSEFERYSQIKNKLDSLVTIKNDVLGKTDKIYRTSSTFKDVKMDEILVTNEIPSLTGKLKDIVTKVDDHATPKQINEDTIKSYDNNDNYLSTGLKNQLFFEKDSILSQSLSNIKYVNADHDTIENNKLNTSKDHVTSQVIIYKIVDGKENVQKDLSLDENSITESVLVKDDFTDNFGQDNLNPDLNQQDYIKHDFNSLSLKNKTSEVDHEILDNFTIGRFLHKSISDASQVMLDYKPKTISDEQVIAPSYLYNEQTDHYDNIVEPNISELKEISGEKTTAFEKDELNSSREKYREGYDISSFTSCLLKPTTKELNNDNENYKVSVDLAFQSYVNNKNEIIFKTFDSTNEPIRYQDDHITMIKSQMRLPDGEIRIPINTENDISLKIKKTNIFNKNPPVNEISITRHIPATSVIHDTECAKQNVSVKYGDKSKSDIKIHDTLITIYKQELVPLQKVIKGLKDDIDSLADHQIFLKDKLLNPRRSKLKLMNFNRKCGCFKRY